MLKYFLVSVLTILFSFTDLNTTEAMTISEPVKIGKLIGVNISGFVFTQTLSNSGDIIRSRQFMDGKKNVYGKGVATFGTNNKKLYIHYQTYDYDKNRSPQISRYGGSSPDNAIQIPTLVNQIYALDTNENINLYVIESDYDITGDENFTLIGERADGRFVKYFDTDTIFESYFGKRDVRRSYFINKYVVNGDTIIFYYGRSDLIPIIGEIRCKWDDKAQWFSVDNVVY